MEVISIGYIRRALATAICAASVVLIGCGSEKSSGEGKGKSPAGNAPEVRAGEAAAPVVEVEALATSEYSDLTSEQVIERIQEAEAAKDFNKAQQWWMAAVEKGKQKSLTDPEYLAALRGLGFHYHFHGPSEKAVSTFLELVKQAEAAEGPNSPLTEDAVLHLGGVYSHMGQLEAADQIFLRLISIREQTYGANSAEVSHALGIRAECLRRLGRESEAAELDKQAADAASAAAAAPAPNPEPAN